VVPGRHWLGTGFIPPMYLREGLMLACAGVGYATTSRNIRKDNAFTFGAIGEVAVLFLGIFLTMTPPMEYLREVGSQLGLRHPAGYFWASGSLSSFLDNAPTYLVFVTLAQSWTTVG